MLPTLLLPTLFPPTSLLPTVFAVDLRIVDFTHPQHAVPGESVLFRITVRNFDSATQFAEVDVTLTEVGTGRETTVVPVATGFIPPGGTATITSTWAAANGIFTVSLPLFDGNGTRVDRVTGRAIHVGTNADTLHVFPEVLNLGAVPPGRFMYPIPLEIHWNFYRSNRLALDQPFALRVYTDNASRYRGIEQSVRPGSPAGLVSEDGRFAIPLKMWSVNFGPSVEETGWDASAMGPPPVDDDALWRGPLLTNGNREVGAVAWLRVPDYSEMTSDPSSWRRVIGQDPHDFKFVTDTNPGGDYTLPSPVTVYVATEGGPATPEGHYTGALVVELWSP